MGVTLFRSGDYESVYLFEEKFIHRIHEVVKFQTKGKNIQAKSVKTARRLQKEKDKEKTKEKKNDKLNSNS